MVETASGLVLDNLATLPQRLSEFNWAPLTAGVEICALLKDAQGNNKVALLRYAAGASVPEHLHVGMEYIQILSGAQQDERGVYPANTLLVSVPGTTHKVASPEGCVALAIWEAPVQFI